MTLRARIAAVASLSVALAVLAAAIGLYVAVRSDLRGEVDRQLRSRARIFTEARPGDRGVPPGPYPGSGTGGTGGTGTSTSGTGTSGTGTSTSGTGTGTGTSGTGATAGSGKGTAAPNAAPPKGGFEPRFPGRVQPEPFGAASGYIEFISSEGRVFAPGGQGSTGVQIPVTALDRSVAARRRGATLSDRTVKGTRLRVLTVAAARGGAVLVARPLSEVDHELSRLLLILVLIGAGGILLAALLGALVARTALAPVARFTARTETLTGSLDLSRRLEVSGRDELGRLATSFNGTLDVLERSVAAQRHLIADASHELRTPIASLRANIQVLGEAERLPAEEQAALHADILAELDSLTALVGDVVELARGAQEPAAMDDVRLDEVVRAAVEQARRRGGTRFELELQETLVSGPADRIGRAVSNLVDNARKWSPPQGAVEITLREGVLCVRDHGPGFEERDLPFVFDRFYRAEEARGMPGSGLGLAIVKQAAEACGGSAEARNAEGGGAMLCVGFGTPVASESSPSV